MNKSLLVNKKPNLLKLGDILNPKIKLSQSEFEALNIVIENQDNRLYSDYTRIYADQSELGVAATTRIQSFFETFLYRHSLDELTIDMFKPIIEDEFVNGCRLGKSEIVRYIKPNGLGPGSHSLHKAFTRIASVEYVKNGFLHNLSNINLFIKGINEDKLSDMIISLIKPELCNFTNEFFLKNPGSANFLESKQVYEQIWCVTEKKWIKELQTAYFFRGERIVLLPKNWVSRDFSYKMRRFMSNFIFEQQLVKDALNIYMKDKNINKFVSDLTLKEKKLIFKEVYGNESKDIIIAVTKNIIKSGNIINIDLNDFMPNDIRDDVLDFYINQPYLK